MCYGGLGQTQRAEAAGVPPFIEVSGSGSGPVPESIRGSAAASSSTEQATGFASCYNLEGRTRQDQKPFDPNDWSGAIYEKGTYGKTVNVFRLDDSSKVISQALNVKINDAGPFALDKQGKPIKPYQPHPTRIIDVTPRVYRELTGLADGKEGPGVIRVRVEWK